jgi:hypothetical protein
MSSIQKNFVDAVPGSLPLGAARALWNKRLHALQLSTILVGIVFTGYSSTALSSPTGGKQPSFTGTIKVGELNSYKAQPAFLEPYKKGMDLALEEVNAAGGVHANRS